MASVSLPATAHNERTASRKYFEETAQYIVTNVRLRFSLFCVAALCVGTLYVNWRMAVKIDHFKPTVVRVNEVGRAEAVSYAQYNYVPQALEIKYFLGQFVKQYYARMRAVTGVDYAMSQFLLSHELQTALEVADRKSPWMQKFLKGYGEENDVDVTNIDLIDFRTPPYRARIDWDKIFYSQARDVSRREHWTTIAVFEVAGPSQNSVSFKYNPLGVTITYFTENQHTK